MFGTTISNKNNSHSLIGLSHNMLACLIVPSIPLFPWFNVVSILKKQCQAAMTGNVYEQPTLVSQTYQSFEKSFIRTQKINDLS